MHLYFFISISLFISACSANSQAPSINEFVGVWKFLDDDDDMLQISSDSILETYSYVHTFGDQYKIEKITNDELTLKNLQVMKSEPQKNSTGYQTLKESNLPAIIVFKYKLSGDSLEMSKEDATQVHKVMHCRTGVCDLQKDFFRKYGVDIDLPILENRENDYQELSLEESDIVVCLGPPKKHFQMFYGQADRIWCDGQYSDENNVRLALYSFASEEVKSSGIIPRMLVFVNSETKMELVDQLIKTCKKQQIETVYFSIRGDQAVSKGFTPLFRVFKVAEIKIDDPGESFASWIK